MNNPPVSNKMVFEFFKSKKTGHICCRQEDGSLVFVSDSVKESLTKGSKPEDLELRIGTTPDGELRIELRPQVASLGKVTL
jgi:hypothetical protein